MFTNYKHIYDMVRRIPPGRVATYGQIARLIGSPQWARQVGYALAALRNNNHQVPWHRVVNAKGEISPRAEPGLEELQRIMLEDEGIVFDDKGFIPLTKFQWRPCQANLPFNDLPSSSNVTNNE